MSRYLPAAPRPKVRVTQDHIDNALASDSGYCMIAEAVKMAVPGADRVTVDLATVRFTDPVKGMRYVYLTPASCTHALVRWDEGVVPEPWNFELRHGQTVRMTRTDQAGKRSRRPVSPAQAAGAAKGLAAARLVQRKSEGGALVPVGGYPPPLSTLAGGAGVPRNRRRIYGGRIIAQAIEKIQAEAAARGDQAG
jgi:hypothetical protein